MRPLLFIILICWLCFCLAVVPSRLEVGLDQRLSMPLDSYVLNYFESIAKFLAVGPPVYFVVTGGHAYDQPGGQNQVCGSSGCDALSLGAQVYSASNMPDA